MSEVETIILELMRGGIKKFDNFISQIPDEFFGLQTSSKEDLKKTFKQHWESNPYQTAKQVLDSIISDVINDITCPSGNSLKQILVIGCNTDFAKPELPEKPIFLGEMTPDDFEGKTFVAKGTKDIN